ncbi:3-keto sterol reductase [Cryptococcus neoformans A2-102-5]|nr:3-keto sterol reductase [Cryptococcus neoformans var. grubii D17-1]OXG96697.1 3-keto sterol reductase [Cryptococcus neoformans var. grubii A2-102-5]
MASIEDLIATISGGLHAGQQGNDIRDLHAKLAQTINNPLPPPVHRPIPPCATTSVSAAGMPPPAPASSWNTPPPNAGFLFSTSPISKINGAGPSGGGGSGNGGGGGSAGADFEVARHVHEGWSVPMPNMGTSFTGRPIQPIVPNGNQQREEGQWRHRNQEFTGDEPEERPYHASVLPIKASPKDTGGFAEDAFKPLWEDTGKDQWQGFNRHNR